MLVTLVGLIAAGPPQVDPISSHLADRRPALTGGLASSVDWTGTRGGPCNHGGVANRRPKTMRDMVLSMGLLAVVALVLFGMYGGVSFSPGRATDGQAPTADVNGGLQRAAPLMGFPVVIPTGLPDSWNPSSFSFTDKAGATTQQPPAVRAGYLTDQGRFITVIQSDGIVADILAAEVGTVSPPTGTEQVGGAEWTVTSGRRDEVAWLRTVGDVTYLITGTASPEDFKTLALAVAAGG